MKRFNTLTVLFCLSFLSVCLFVCFFLFPPPRPAVASPLACLWRVYFSLYPPNGEFVCRLLCTCSTLFLYIYLPLLCTTTTWNFQKLPAYNWFHVLWRKCRTCPCSLFFSLAHLALIFTLHLVAASISYFLTAATKSSCFSLNKISVSFVFYLSLSPPPLPPPPSLSLSRLSSFTAFFPSHHMKFFLGFFLRIDVFLYHF